MKKTSSHFFSIFNPIQDGSFWSCSRIEEEGESEICHTYPTMMKLGTITPDLNRIHKIYDWRDAPLEFCWHQHFFSGNQQILLYQKMQIKISFWFIISNLFNFFWVFKGCFNKHGYNFDDISILDLLKINVFWNKDYDLIICVHEVTNKIFSSNSNYFVDVVMWPRFGNSSVSMREVIIISLFVRIWPEKPPFLRGGLGWSSVIWDWH